MHYVLWWGTFFIFDIYVQSLSRWGTDMYAMSVLVGSIYACNLVNEGKVICVYFKESLCLKLRIDRIEIKTYNLNFWFDLHKKLMMRLMPVMWHECPWHDAWPSNEQKFCSFISGRNSKNNNQGRLVYSMTEFYIQ